MEKRIDRLQRLAAARPTTVIGLGGGLPADQLFPRAKLARAFVQAMREPGASALQYAWPEGREQLRAWVAARLRARGAAVEPAEVLITAGAQQALAIAAQLSLARGDLVEVGAETYPAALDLFRARGAVPVAAAPAARVAYVQPAIGNPRGLPMTPEARAELLDRGIALIEDDAYADLRFDGPTPPPLLVGHRERVWHVGTFSKVLCPGLRVGWLVPPPEWHERAMELKHASDLQSSSLGQTVLELFLARDDFDQRIAEARTFYRRRAERLMRALQRHLPRWRFVPPAGGFALFVEADEEGDDLTLLEVATAGGISFDPGRMFRPDDARTPLALRLCFSYAGAAELDEGARRLAGAWDRYRALRDRQRPGVADGAGSP